jgi:hypothetical protein
VAGKRKKNREVREKLYLIMHTVREVLSKVGRELLSQEQRRRERERKRKRERDEWAYTREINERKPMEKMGDQSRERERERERETR